MKVSNYNKYHAQKQEVDGIRFPSKREANRYQDLKLLQIAGEIRNLEWQVAFDLEVNGIKICRYVADFRYDEKQARGRPWLWFDVIEDCKGYRTPVYKLKKKLMLACYGIEIRET